MVPIGKNTQPLYKEAGFGVEAIKYGDVFISPNTNGDRAANRRTPQMEFLDSMRMSLGKNGTYDHGYVHGLRKIDPTDWFFHCHFWMDPVMPGSLGVEALFQMLETYVLCYQKQLDESATGIDLNSCTDLRTSGKILESSCTAMLYFSFAITERFYNEPDHKMKVYPQSSSTAPAET